MFQPSETNIQPYTEKTNKVIASFSVKILEIELHTKAILLVCLYDTNKNFVECRKIIMQGNDYNNWGQDDNYINNFVARTLGYDFRV